jgi:hypothetical protein
MARVTAAYKAPWRVPGIQLGLPAARPDGRGPGMAPCRWRGEGAAHDRHQRHPVARGLSRAPKASHGVIERVRGLSGAAGRALLAGSSGRVNGAHGYLLHSFLSPLSKRGTTAMVRPRRPDGADPGGGTSSAMLAGLIPSGFRVSAQDGVEGAGARRDFELAGASRPSASTCRLYC